MFEEPEIHLVDFSGLGEEYRAERDRQAGEARRRYLARLELLLIGLGLASESAPAWAEALLDGLFTVVPVEGGDPCQCSCHPHLPESDLHDYGFGCACQQTTEERRRFWDDWRADMEAFWDSPEGKASRARRQAEEDELMAWLVTEPDVVVTSYGGLAPEQWEGSVDGHMFYFRERHDQWRIELDLRPNGHFSKVWKGGDLDDEQSFEWREMEQGDVIAKGSTGAFGYGESPVERARFIVRTIRDHIGRNTCALHTAGRVALEQRLGLTARWCPACGARLEP